MFFLSIILLATSCATTLNSLDKAKNSDKYERELEYREGDTINLSIDLSDEITRNDLKYGSITIQKQNVSRFGLTGPLKIHVTNVAHPYEKYKILTHEDKDYLYSNLKSKFSLTAKVKKVSRECRVAEHELYSSTCYNDEFKDELFFESWGSDLQSKVDERIKIRTAINQKDSEDELSINKEIQFKCGSYELKLRDLKKRMESYTQYEMTKNIKNKLDEEIAKRKVEELGKQYNSELINPKYKGCPSNISDQLVR